MKFFVEFANYCFPELVAFSKITDVIPDREPESMRPCVRNRIPCKADTPICATLELNPSVLQNPLTVVSYRQLIKNRRASTFSHFSRPVFPSCI